MGHGWSICIRTSVNTTNNWFHCFNFLLGEHIVKHLLVQAQRRQWHPTPVLLPGKSHGWRSLAGCGSLGHTELVRHDWSDLTAAAAAGPVYLQHFFFLLLLFSSRCFQNAALGPVIFSITWELARNENYLPPPLTYWIRTPELRLRNLLTNHTSRWIWDIPSVKPTPVFLRGDSHGQRSLVGYSP